MLYLSMPSLHMYSEALARAQTPPFSRGTVIAPQIWERRHTTLQHGGPWPTWITLAKPALNYYIAIDKVIPGMNPQEFQWVGRQVVVLLVVHHSLLEYVAESLQCTLLKGADRVLHLYITAHVHSNKFESISQIAFLRYLQCPHGPEYERWPSVPK